MYILPTELVENIIDITDLIFYISIFLSPFQESCLFDIFYFSIVFVLFLWINYV